MSWISVNEWMPNHGDTVRSKSADGRIFRTQMFAYGSRHEFKIVGYVWEHSGVTHWTYEDGEVSGYDD